MQIMPATGSQLAANLGWPADYDDERSLSPGDKHPTRRPLPGFTAGILWWKFICRLAAYNGGPGNTMIWNDLAQGDLDLLLEVVRIQETRDYIRRVVENFAIYRGLYGRGSGG